MNLTVLQSIYKNDKPQYLMECFESLFNQTVLPDSIILVKDGIISSELESVIEYWKEKLPLNVVGYEENRGLAYALNYGFQFVETELVARMDSDDVACIDRFEKQKAYMEAHPEVSFLSGYIAEFNLNPKDTISIRKVPSDYQSICKTLKSRNAMNHMAVCFRKTAVEKSGGYQEVPFFEDYDLWIRMIQNGFRAENIPEILVYARIGNDMIGRRHGIEYVRHELFFLKKQLRSGFINKNEYKRLVLIRIPVRLLPKRGLKLVYKFLRSQSSF